jgi:hypothetical protein
MPICLSEYMAVNALRATLRGSRGLCGCPQRAPNDIEKAMEDAVTTNAGSIKTTVNKLEADLQFQ